MAVRAQSRPVRRTAGITGLAFGSAATGAAVLVTMKMIIVYSMGRSSRTALAEGRRPVNTAATTHGQRLRRRETVAHLLMVESWVGSMSRLLPRAIREGGHEFTFLTRDLHHYLRSAPEGAAHPLLGARNVLTADTNDLETLLPYVERLHSALGFDGVITSCDYYLPTVARIAGRLGLPGPAPEAVENACRKDATRRVLAAAGVPGPRFAVCADRSEAAAAARGDRLSAGAQARRPVRGDVRPARRRRGGAGPRLPRARRLPRQRARPAPGARGPARGAAPRPRSQRRDRVVRRQLPRWSG